MADVQLEHGHYRLANALDEAITIASFSGTQHKIVRCVLRLTWGWRQQSVRMSRVEIAERCGVAPVGGFLRAFDDLVHNGVIDEVERPFGRTPGAYRINKDFEHWGVFSVAQSRLEALFRKRPATADRPTPEGQSSEPPRQTPQGQSSNGVRQTPEGESPSRVSNPVGMDDRPYRVPHTDPIGSVTGVVSDEKKEVAAAERHERQERHTTTTTPPVSPAPKTPDLSAAGPVRSLLISEDDRNAFDTIMSAVPFPLKWATEMARAIDGQGMHGLVLSAEQLGEALRDYVANGKHLNPALISLREHMRVAARGRREPAERSGRSNRQDRNLEILKRSVARREGTNGQ